MKLGLIGNSLVHSFSPGYFAEKFKFEGLTNYSYQTYEMDNFNQHNLFELIKGEKLSGFNVTIPYKEAILPLLNELSEDALQIGAVNTVEVMWLNDEEYILKGHNTDWTGFLKAIRPFLTVNHQKALILGTGGASKAIAHALKTLGIDFYFAGRTRQEKIANLLLYSELNQFAIEQFKLIVNTTPLGTFPAINDCPAIPYQFVGSNHLLCDLIYNPAETAFMKHGKLNGASVMNGLSMLQFQADEAWTIWKNKKGHSV